MSLDLETIGVGFDTSGLERGTRAFKENEQAANRAADASDKLSGKVDILTRLYRDLAAAATAWKVLDHIKEMAMLNARYETLGVVMKVVGANAGYTAREMDAAAAGMQKMGISMVESRQQATRLVQAHIDLSNASKLARIAQDAAVIGNMNSSEAFAHMIHGIQTGQTEVLRTIGLNISMENSYKLMAAQLHKHSDALTQNEKTQAILNAVMKAGGDIAGTYAASMDTAGKQLLSMKRYTEDLKVIQGEVFNEVLTVSVMAFTEHLKDANGEVSDMARNGELKQWGEDLADTFVFVAESINSLIVLTKLAGTAAAKVAADLAVSRQADKDRDAIAPKNMLGFRKVTPEIAKQLDEIDAAANRQHKAIEDAYEESHTKILASVGRFNRALEERRAANAEKEAKAAVAAGDHELQRLINQQNVVIKAKQAAEDRASVIAKQTQDKNEAAYKSAIKSISERAAALRLEDDAQGKLTEGQKFAIKILDDLRTGELKLSQAKAGVLGKMLEELLKQEALNDAKKVAEKATLDAAQARVKYIDTMSKSLDKMKEDVAKQQEYNDRIGLSKVAIAELDAAKLEDQATTLDGLAIKQLDKNLDIEQYDLLKAKAEQLRKNAQLKRDGALKEASYDEAQKAAEEWRRTADQINQALTDSLMRGFESGKGFAENLRDTVVNMFKTMVLRPVVSAILSPVAGTLAGAMGAPGGGLSQGVNYINAGSSLWSAASGGMSAGLGGAISGVGNFLGSSTISSFGAGMQGASLAPGLMGPTTAGAGGAMGAGASFASAMPYLAAAAAIYAIAKSLDHSGTYHTGALAEYSAATGLQTGSNGSHAGPRAGDTNYGTGFGGVDFSQQTADFVGGISKSIVGILDSTASTFGKTAGYTAATAFADDTSKDGAWGALLISKLGEKIVDWQDTRNSSWAPREFGDGEAGRTQYLAELSKSVRTALDDIGLPGWAQSMLDNLGNAPALTDLAAVVDKINAVQNSLVSMGTAIAGFSNLSDGAVSALISASGGVDAFTSGMSAFYQGYYTDAEKLANVSTQVSDALSAVGLQMPQTREEFRDLVQANLALGEAGAPAVAALLKVSGAFGTIADSATAASDRENALAKSRSDLEIQIMELSGDSSGALAAKRALELAGMDASLRPLQERIYLLQDEKTATDAAKVAAQTALNDAMKGVDAAFSAVQRAVDAERKSITDAYNDQIKSINASITDVTGSVGKLTSLSNSLRSTIDRMRLSSDLGSDRSGAMAQIQSVLAIAKAGGVFPDAESIASALNTISQPFDQLFGNATDYKRELMRQKDVLGQLADLTDSQKSIQERTLESLQDQLKVTEQGYSDEMTRLDGVLSAAQLQIDTLRGIDQSVMSVAAAIANLQINVGTAATAQANLSALTGTQPDSITGLYSNILGRQADATGAAFWQNALITNPKSWDGVVTDFINGALTGGTQSDKENALAWARANHIPGFAVGTSYVPYDMTARIHAGEEITPRPYVDIQRADRSRTNDLLSQLVEENRSMRAEIALLHSDNSAENRAIAQHANKTAKLMERAMPDGDAIATRVAV